MRITSHVAKIVWTVTLLSTPFIAHSSGRDHPEKYYQEQWCGAIKEYTLEDRTRVDCMTVKYAIEIDFADKWAEGIGQSLHYALMSDRRPGLALIVEDEQRDMAHVRKAKRIILRYQLPTKLWIVRSGSKPITYVRFSKHELY